MRELLDDEIQHYMNVKCFSPVIQSKQSSMITVSIIFLIECSLQHLLDRLIFSEIGWRMH